MQIKRINELIEIAHKNAKDAGWWDDLPESEDAKREWLADKIDLIAGEGAEAVEALRNGRYADRKSFELAITRDFPTEHFKAFIKDTFEDEIADIAIRTMDLMGFYGLKFDDIRALSDEDRYIIEQRSTKERIRRIRATALLMSCIDTINGHSSNMILYMCMMIAQNEGFDLDWHIVAKMEYNKTRGRKHGKAF